MNSNVFRTAILLAGLGGLTVLIGSCFVATGTVIATPTAAGSAVARLSRRACVDVIVVPLQVSLPSSAQSERSEEHSARAAPTRTPAAGSPPRTASPCPAPAGLLAEVPAGPNYPLPLHSTAVADASTPRPR